MALKNEWQALRQQRQQAVKMRRNQVNQSLLNWQKDRADRGQAFREELERFREELFIQDVQRSHSAQVAKCDRQIFCQRLDQQTQEFLSSCNQQRQTAAAEFAQNLQDFARSLSEKTAAFLALSNQERQLMAEIWREELQAFHTALTVSVSQLRQALQAENKTRQTQTHQFLLNRQQFRQKNRRQLTEDLINFVETLRLEIYGDLYAMALLRKTRSQQLQQSLTENRAQRLATLENFSDRMTQFRAELADHSQQLRQEIWGTDEQIKPENSSAIAPQPQVPAVVAPSALPSAPSDKVPYEQDVYNYIRQVQAARLGDTESALAINRIQTVDALRSLLKKGLITQRDRVYVLS